jgi:hypothetical protein
LNDEVDSDERIADSDEFNHSPLEWRCVGCAPRGGLDEQIDVRPVTKSAMSNATGHLVQDSDTLAI